MADRPPPEALPTTQPAESAGGPRAASSWMPVWLRRFGLAGFLFFLVKGLLWLALPTLLVVFGGRC